MFETVNSGRNKGPQPELPISKWRRIWRIFWIPIAVAALVDGWVVFSRWQEEQRNEEQAQDLKRASDKSTYEFLGGSRFEILHFYASPGVLKKGDTGRLCYGVSNAKAVSIDPAAGNAWPSANRCLEISPVRDTTYTLTIEDAKGLKKSQSLTVRVQ
ncbi:MAG: hypothetical protein HY046_01660 [Acidobacteria bacterium]|nr:hypothetical protein [Acidobacteriota bacterium]